MFVVSQPRRYTSLLFKDSGDSVLLTLRVF
nr:MAG TPA: hypothetical protein [Bacteriophage sp.]